jgi:hypothetical protein
MMRSGLARTGRLYRAGSDNEIVVPLTTQAASLSSVQVRFGHKGTKAQGNSNSLTFVYLWLLFSLLS